MACLCNSIRIWLCAYESTPQGTASADAMIREGGCLCGVVRFRCEGEPINVRICHCPNCQKAMGSPFFARALFDQNALTVESETARYASSETLDRVFARFAARGCSPCGETARRRALRLRHSTTATPLHQPNNIRVTEKMDWVRLEDGLPQYPGTAP